MKKSKFHTPLIGLMQVDNFLSFGKHRMALELRPLNILIGPNGSGKSNLIEAISLMRSTPKDHRVILRKGGGAAEWIHKAHSDEAAFIHLEFIQPELIKLDEQEVRPHSSHVLQFRVTQQLCQIVEETIRHEAHNFISKSKPDRTIILRSGDRTLTSLEDSDLSILAQRRDPERYPEFTWLSSTYEKIRIYREWSFGRNAVFRDPQKADLRNDTLEEDFSNLGLFLNRIRTKFPAAKKAILNGLRDLYGGIDDFDVSIEGGTVQVFFTEGNFVIPATRLSDGTLRYLCLLAILCNPEPPPLTCIEEPELGLHPDILPKLADLLREASTRGQLIVTTHSDILIDAMSKTPEVVVVCSKEEGETRMERLKADDLKEWLTKYRLGQLWMKGQIGGTRW